MERAAAGCLSGEFAAWSPAGPPSGWLRASDTRIPARPSFRSALGRRATMAFCGGRLRVACVLACAAAQSSRLPHRCEFRAGRPGDGELARAEGIAAPRLGVCGLIRMRERVVARRRMNCAIIKSPILSGLRAAFPGLSLCQRPTRCSARTVARRVRCGDRVVSRSGLPRLKSGRFRRGLSMSRSGCRTSDEVRTTARPLTSPKEDGSPAVFRQRRAVARRLIAVAETCGARGY